MSTMKARLAVVGALAGVAIVAGVVVFVFFARLDPSPPSLEDDPHPEIPGSIVYANERNCIIVADASGESREEVHCTSGLAWVTWLDEGVIGFGEFRSGGSRWLVLDLATGDVRETSYTQHPSLDRTFRSPRGEEVTVDPNGDVYRITDGERTRIFEFDGPENYQPWPVTWSPDGEWVLLQYWHRDDMELWIVRRDGSVAGTLAENVSGSQVVASWWIDGEGYLPQLDRTPPLD